MTSLFISLLYDTLNEYAYDAELAGIMYKIVGTVYSMDVRTQNNVLMSRNYVGDYPGQKT